MFCSGFVSSDRWQFNNYVWCWFSAHVLSSDRWQFNNYVWCWFSAHVLSSARWQFSNYVWCWFIAHVLSSDRWQFSNYVWCSCSYLSCNVLKFLVLFVAYFAHPKYVHFCNILYYETVCFNFIRGSISSISTLCDILDINICIGKFPYYGI